jgi:hypothetical protein
VYLHDVARAISTGAANAYSLTEEWRAKFHKVHYERYSTRAPAAMAEVTPRRPAFDYRLQRSAWWRARKEARAAHESSAGARSDEDDVADGRSRRRRELRDPSWTYWREALVSYPAQANYAELNDVLSDLADLYYGPRITRMPKTRLSVIGFFLTR